jgi:hypothetical protein
LSSARSPLLLDLVEDLIQPVERVIVAGVENLFLVLEVVVEIALLHVERRRRSAPPVAPVIAELAKGLGGALEDFHAVAALGSTLRRRRRFDAIRFEVDSRVATVLK